MVGRSLIVKVYLYAAVTLVLLFALGLGIGRSFMHESRAADMQTMRSAIAIAVGLRYEAALADNTISPGEERGLLPPRSRAAVSYVPWGQRNGYPSQLQQEKVYWPRGTAVSAPEEYFVRVDHAGAPVGVLKISFPPSDGPPPTPLVRFLIVLLAALALVTVPPLYIWVLRPLARMQAVAHRLGEGDFETPVRIDRQDELGELQQAFERMRTQIRGMFAQRERLLRDISHELRGPLSRMAIAVPILRAEHGEDRMLDELEREVGTMDAMIGEVLTLARARSPEALETEALDLAEIAREALESRRIVLADRALAIDSALASAPVRGDRRLLLRAAGNLIDNAIKYTPDPGRLSVTTRREGDRSVLAVSDTGPGIAAEHLPRIFDPFYRPDTSRSRETGGTGLGLSIAKAIAESHSGDLQISSPEAHGTTATLSLPTQ